MNKGLLIVLVIASLLIGGVVGFRMGVRIFADPQVAATHKMIRDYIRECKKTAKISDAVDQEGTKGGQLG
jgi:hypothetical protein